jgi:hypothetical protein
VYHAKCARKAQLAASFSAWRQFIRHATSISTAENVLPDKVRLATTSREEVLGAQSVAPQILPASQPEVIQRGADHTLIPNRIDMQCWTSEAELQQLQAPGWDRDVASLPESRRRLELFESQASEWARERADMLELIALLESSLRDKTAELQQLQALGGDRNVALLLESRRRLELFESQASEWARERADMLDLTNLLESSLRDKTVELQLLHSRAMKEPEEHATAVAEMKEKQLHSIEMIFELQQQSAPAVEAAAAVTMTATRVAHIHEAPDSALSPLQRRDADAAAQAAAVVGGHETTGVFMPKQQQQESIDVSKHRNMLDLTAKSASLNVQPQQHHRQLEQQLHQRVSPQLQEFGSQNQYPLGGCAGAETATPVHTMSVAYVLANHAAFNNITSTSSNGSVGSVSSIGSSYSPAGNILRTQQRLQQNRTWNSKTTSQSSSGEASAMARAPAWVCNSGGCGSQLRRFIQRLETAQKVKWGHATLKCRDIHAKVGPAVRPALALAAAVCAQHS